MSIGLYLISKDDIKHKLRDFIENYSDLNGHFLESEVHKGSLLTVYTDLGIENLAFELQIPVGHWSLRRKDKPHNAVLRT